MAKILYRRQRQILDFITQYIQKFGYSPTLAEIAEAFNISALSTVSEHLKKLEEKGFIRRFKGAVRGIEVFGCPLSQGVELPVVGFISAGQPIEPFPEPYRSIFVPQHLLSGKKRAFVLQVKGNSMIEEGILEGDYIVVEETREVQNGDTVVALLENGFVTVKKFYQENGRIRLQPANHKLKPLYVKDVTIQGKVVGIIRKF